MEKREGCSSMQMIWWWASGRWQSKQGRWRHCSVFEEAEFSSRLAHLRSGSEAATTSERHASTHKTNNCITHTDYLYGNKKSLCVCVGNTKWATRRQDTWIWSLQLTAVFVTKQSWKIFHHNDICSSYFCWLFWQKATDFDSLWSEAFSWRSLWLPPLPCHTLGGSANAGSGHQGASYQFQLFTDWSIMMIRLNNGAVTNGNPQH